MSESKFVTYEKFRSQKAAAEVAELLTAENIEFLLEDDSLNFDVSFANNETNKEYRIKLKQEDFDRANAIRDQLSSDLLDSVEADYYLLEFTNDELIDLIAKRDEWSHFDYMLAQKILKERGQEVTEKDINDLKDQRMEELSKPEKSQVLWVGIGYVLALLGGFLGCLIGWHLMSHKKTLPNGERVHAYSQTDRSHGTRILILGIGCAIIWLTVRILKVI